MATLAEVEQQLAAARATLGQLGANQGAVLREVGALNAEARALRAESNKLYQGGDQAGAKLLREQEGALEKRQYELSEGPAAQALAAEQAKIRTLENDLYRAQQKAEFDAKQTADSCLVLVIPCVLYCLPCKCVLYPCFLGSPCKVVLTVLL